MNEMRLSPWFGLDYLVACLLWVFKPQLCFTIVTALYTVHEWRPMCSHFHHHRLWSLLIYNRFSSLSLSDLFWRVIITDLYIALSMRPWPVIVDSWPGVLVLGPLGTRRNQWGTVGEWQLECDFIFLFLFFINFYKEDNFLSLSYNS